MKSSTIPTFCTVCLAAMSAAGASHWWSVNHFVTAFHAGLVSFPKVQSVGPVKRDEPAIARERVALPMPLSSEDKRFNDLVLKKFDALENQNKDLLGQLAETNRDMINLNFRVDTQSSSYRPMPASETQSETAFGDAPSVLPPPPYPRADPVFLPEDE